ncbi:quinoprotein glucose dehydrogenase, partial [Paenibacillus sepulcri]|nr:quinoprotein glucose dehydrogenase [Paenibacillus sepulcri]
MLKAKTMMCGVLLTMMLTACGNESNRAANPAEPIDVDRQTSRAEGDGGAGYEVLAEGLQSPWAIDFSGDLIYVSERDGAIVQIKDGQMTRQKLQLSNPVKQEGEGG